MIELRALAGDDLTAALDAVAGLRIAVFRDWPYLYDGTLAFERQYLAGYVGHPGALVLGAFDGARLIGASTSAPMEDNAEAFGDAVANLGVPLTDVLYGAESVLLPDYRGQGIGGRFIAAREAHARNLGRHYVGFFSVERPADHPLRPANARTNDAFWRRNGYAPLPGVKAEFFWRDVGDATETAKTLQFWIRTL